jgi:hypothetical protein
MSPRGVVPHRIVDSCLPTRPTPDGEQGAAKPVVREAAWAPPGGPGGRTYGTDQGEGHRIDPDRCQRGISSAVDEPASPVRVIFSSGC